MTLDVINLILYSFHSTILSIITTIIDDHHLIVIMYFSSKASAKRTFVREISHELRTPLNSACIGLDIISEACNDKSKFQSIKNQQFITDIRESLQEAIQILNELLMYDKIESGVLELEITSSTTDFLVLIVTIYIIIRINFIITITIQFFFFNFS